jgi:hypothetical protein
VLKARNVAMAFAFQVARRVGFKAIHEITRNNTKSPKQERFVLFRVISWINPAAAK